MPESQSLFRRIKQNWEFMVGAAALFAWIITQIIVAMNSISVANMSIAENKEDIQEVQVKIKEHDTSGSSHFTLSERMTKVEAEVKHIQTTQTINFRDIKDQLKTIQQDVKVVRGRGN